MDGERNYVQSVQRAFALIELLSGVQEMALSELSRLSGLHKTTVFRLLGTLEALGYVRRNPANERYALTLKFLKISSNGLAHSNVHSRLRPILRGLSQEFGETVHLVERSGDSVIYIDKFESDRNSIRMVSQIGMEQDMTTTAVGKALLARADDAEVRRIWDGTPHPEKTPHTITDFSAFTAELAEIRANGWAVDNEENELGVRCVAAAVPDAFGEYRHAVSVSAPIARMDRQTVRQIAARLLDAVTGI